MKVNKKYSGLLFGISMSLMMSFTMSFFMMLINIGLVPDFLSLWAKGFLVGFVVAFPTSMIAAPLSKKIANKLT